jgi:hypothetical protein
MESYMDMTHAGEENVGVIVSILESIFSPRPETAAELEHKILSQMQRKLDRTVVKMKKQGKRPTEIRRNLTEIRKEHYLELEKLRNKEET